MILVGIVLRRCDFGGDKASSSEKKFAKGRGGVEVLCGGFMTFCGSFVCGGFVALYVGGPTGGFVVDDPSGEKSKFQRARVKFDPTLSWQWHISKERTSEKRGSGAALKT